MSAIERTDLARAWQEDPSGRKAQALTDSAVHQAHVDQIRAGGCSMFRTMDDDVVSTLENATDNLHRKIENGELNAIGLQKIAEAFAEFRTELNRARDVTQGGAA